MVFIQIYLTWTGNPLGKYNYLFVCVVFPRCHFNADHCENKAKTSRHFESTFTAVMQMDPFSYKCTSLESKTKPALYAYVVLYLYRFKLFGIRPCFDHMVTRRKSGPTTKPLKCPIFCVCFFFVNIEEFKNRGCKIKKIIKIFNYNLLRNTQR